MTAAAGRRQRAALLRDVARDLKSKDRAKLIALRGRVRAMRAERKEAIASALSVCAARSMVPTQRQVLDRQRAQKAAAKAACDLATSKAKALRDPIARARAERQAEQSYQRDMRRIARLQREREHAQRKRRGGVVRASPRQETDQEVRGNIPPELVPLFNRVRGQIRGSDRISRTEAFLHYAEEHPGEQWDALEDRIDATIAEMERRQAMPNPKKKSKARKRAPKKMTISKTRTKTRVTVRNPSPAFAHVKKQLERSRAESRRLRAKLSKRKKNPRRPPKRWFDRCLASVTAQKYARDPAAVCSAAWWKMPTKKREAIVRRYERGSPRQRRVAVAIAKAERNHADGPPRRRNPAMSDAEAAREYTRTHWGEKGRQRIVRKGAADPRFGTATKLGKLVAVVYRTRKGGDDGPTDYEHEFEGKLPDLLYNDGGLVVAGGQYVIREGGIDG